MRIASLALLVAGLASAHAQTPDRPGVIRPGVIRPGVIRPDVSPHPWTDAPFRDDPGDFQFVVVADRTGGMNPGVFERAVSKVNLLRPEFVISVGDLIDGYTESPAVWTAQWDEFDRIVDGLDAPFFYVPGNHDVSNAAMEGAWTARYGPTYYSFVYKDVLMLVVNTDERWPDGGVGEAQVESVRQALAAHPDVRWTLVFMHRPLFAYGDMAGYERIDALLRGRRHTVFAGHHHHYLKSVRGGADHLILGTTGGGNDGRGAAFGEFDHLTWVTMTDAGPVVAHVELDGLHDREVVNEASYRLVRPLREGSWLAAEPVLSATPAASRLASALVLTNTADRPMRVSGALAPVGLVRFEPATVDTVVASGATLRLPLALVADAPQTVEAVAEAGVAVELSAAYTRDDGLVLSLPARREVALDWQHTLPVRTAQIDGDLSEWDVSAMLRAFRPAFLQEGWDWQGPDDGWFRFAAAEDGGELVVAVEAFDDRFLAGAAVGERQDKILVELYGVPGEAPLRVEVAPSASPDAPLVSVSDPAVPVRAASRRTERGLVAEIALPRPAGPFRLNVGMMDHDRPENTKPSVLWWRPRASAGEAGGGPFSRP